MYEETQQHIRSWKLTDAKSVRAYMYWAGVTGHIRSYSPRFSVRIGRSATCFLHLYLNSSYDSAVQEFTLTNQLGQGIQHQY